ncbi:MAG TPA: PHP domain-containing protein [Oligoflexia bacterium]|nr:PHP domain-containing protein [Oligoflexia bacterium]HMR23790.1 PHP domain-containing protein [Oligoflexia bacterium]
MSEKKYKKIAHYIVEHLKQTVFFLKLDGANVFKVRAYEKAINIIDEMANEFYPYLEQQNFTDIDGIGKGLSADILELSEGNKSTVLQSLLKKYPENLYQLKKIKGLGSKKILKLYTELSVTSLADLEYACYEGLLVKLDGFGEKTQTKILEQLNFLKSTNNLYTYAFLCEKAKELVMQLKTMPEVQDVVITGELRRCMEVAASIELLILTQKSKPKIDNIDNLILSKDAMDKDKIYANYQNIPVVLYPCTKQNYGSVLFKSTGSQAFIQEICTKQLDVLEHQHETEESVFKAMKVEYCLPELRESKKEYIKINNTPAPGSLLESTDIQGVFHMHSTYSDGKNTLEEMVKRSIELGYQYIGISEHSQTAFYARGLNLDTIKQQAQEIKTLRKKYPQIHILHGIESDILPDGQLDYPDSVLKQLDFVIASVHAYMNQSEDLMTQRCLKALENPYCTMLGHPTGRVLLGRDSFKINLEAIFKKAGELGKFIEINANPKRLDLDWRYIPLAIKHKVKLVVNPDAHSIDGLSHTFYGVNVARKGGLTKKNVINTLPLEKLSPLLNMGSLKYAR